MSCQSDIVQVIGHTRTIACHIYAVMLCTVPLIARLCTGLLEQWTVEFAIGSVHMHVPACSCHMKAATVTSACKYAQCKDRFGVRTTHDVSNHCILNAVATQV